MRSHEAGVLHAEGYGGPPLYLPYPTDVMELLPQLWPRSVDRDEAGRLTVGTDDPADIIAAHLDLVVARFADLDQPSAKGPK